MSTAEEILAKINLAQMNSIYLVKVTRRPVLMLRCRTAMAHDEMNDLAKYVGRMQSGGLCPPGVSIQLVDSEFDEQIKKIEAGSLAQHGIPVLYQINGV